MIRRAISHPFLMDMSESCIDMTRMSKSEEDRSRVEHLFDRPSNYKAWESSHYSLMKATAVDQTLPAQLMKMRATCLALAHQTALFEHLRTNHVVGDERRALFANFYPSIDYTKAVIAEHQKYLRWTSSLLCTNHLETTLLRDSRFIDRLDAYRSQYMEYFSTYCDWIVAEFKGQDCLLQPLLIEMKKDISTERSSLLSTPDKLELTGTFTRTAA